MEETIKELQKIVTELKEYRRDVYNCDMCNNRTTLASEYPCNECKRSYRRKSRQLRMQVI